MDVLDAALCKAIDDLAVLHVVTDHEVLLIYLLSATGNVSLAHCIDLVKYEP